MLDLSKFVFDPGELPFWLLLSKPVRTSDLTSLSVDLVWRVLSESTIAEVVPVLLVLKSEAVLTSLLLIGSTITPLLGVLLVVANTVDLVERPLVVLVELPVLNRLFVVNVLVLSLELTVVLDEVMSLDDLAVRLDPLDRVEGVDVVTVLRTFVGIVRVVDLVVDKDGVLYPWFNDGACELRDVAVEVPTYLFVLVETDELLVRPVGELLVVVLLLVLRLVLLFITGVEGALLTDGAIGLVAGWEVGLEGELLTVAGAGLADLLLRSAEPEEPDLSPLAKHGTKRRLKTNPPNTILIFIFFNANMINLLSATKFLIAALTATGSWLLLFGFTRSSRA